MTTAAAVYSSPLLRGVFGWLLEGGLHPGGARMSQTTVSALRLGAGARVVDLGGGAGALGGLLAQRSMRPLVVDLGAKGCLVGCARGDMRALPLRAGSMDGAVAECALCLASSWSGVLEEVARVLRPGGRLVFSDFVRGGGGAWPAPQWARVACVADAVDEPTLRRHLEGAGFADVVVEDHSWALDEIEARVMRRLDVLGLLRAWAAGRPGSDAERLLATLEQARAERDAGVLRYVLVHATRR